MAFLLLAPPMPKAEQFDSSHPTKKPGLNKPGQTQTQFVIFGGLAVFATSWR
jgi:hypothetical protein